MYRHFSTLFILTLLAYGCAQQGSPSGGPRDEDPPQVIEADPANYSRNFSAEKILLTFDEYIVLDNVNQELIISPPMEEKPGIKLRNKTIIIEFDEELKENTTYTFNFGNAIKDLHEGNKLINFEYVFATGEEIDTLSVKGLLRNSFDLSEPKDPIMIMLYSDLRDSVPLTDLPFYIGKSMPDGSFSVNNLKSEVFKIFAIKDANNNFLFDQPNEEIAFLDSSLIVSAEYFRNVLRLDGTLDSIERRIDSLQVLADSALIDKDSLELILPDLNSVFIDLYLFTEESENQYLSDYKRDDPRKLELEFNNSLTDSFRYHLIESEVPNEEIFLEVFSTERDSLILWIRDSLYFKRDTLGLTFAYTTRDSTNNPIQTLDTILLNYRKKETSKRKKEKPADEKLVVRTITAKKKQDLHKEVGFNFNFPIYGIDESYIHLSEIPDSIENPVTFVSRIDSLRYLSAYLSYKWESDMKYHLEVFPGAFKSIYDLPHDTISVLFSGQDQEYYGRILINLENVQNDIIIQLLVKDKVVQERIVNSSGLHEFPFLKPETYKIKFIHDRNGNGEWDTGKYIKKLQPETVEFLPIEITVRSNWDHDATHILKN